MERVHTCRVLVRALTPIEGLLVAIGFALSAWIGWESGFASLLLGEMVLLRAKAASSGSHADWMRIETESIRLLLKIAVGSFVGHLCCSSAMRLRANRINQDPKNRVQDVELLEFTLKMSQSAVSAVVALPIALFHGWDLLLVVFVLSAVFFYAPTMLAAAEKREQGGLRDSDTRKVTAALQLKHIWSHSRSIQVLDAMEAVERTLGTALDEVFAMDTTSGVELFALHLELMLALLLPSVVLAYVGWKASGEDKSSDTLRCVLIAGLAALTFVRAVVNGQGSPTREEKGTPFLIDEAMEARVCEWLRPHALANDHKVVAVCVGFVLAPVIMIVASGVMAQGLSRLFGGHDTWSIALWSGSLLVSGLVLSFYMQRQISLLMDIGREVQHRVFAEVMKAEFQNGDDEASEQDDQAVDCLLGDLPALVVCAMPLFPVTKWSANISLAVMLVVSMFIDWRVAILHVMAARLSKKHVRYAGQYKTLGQLHNGCAYAYDEALNWFISACTFSCEMRWITTGLSSFHSVVLISIIDIFASGSVCLRASEAPELLRLLVLEAADRILQRKTKTLSHNEPLPPTGNRSVKELKGEVSFEDVPITSGKTTHYFRSKLAAGKTTVVYGGSSTERRSLVLCMLQLPGWDRIPTGNIFLDGVNVSQLDQTWLRQHVTLLDVDPVLIDASVADNIALGCPDASWEDIKRVAVMSGLLPCYLAEALKDNVHRASTQAWLKGCMGSLSIARILIRQPKVIIVDEENRDVDDLTDSSGYFNLVYWLVEILDQAEVQPTIVVFARDERSTAWGQFADHFICI
ncbi:hypothetical protein Poli38472_001250 [Pythium oligandrum]|uniref:Uncharacterized protein n=1 Tax=Pythium oligandrum TaxID=41045 RepID=A0A8K1CTR5_PYTOL|nr:hypothetical protein Poli38472_001250 [Pythium oligandrum]|eukprot:TMW69094.1 hypothetical protein Poli38472_001250 [Pythium oligandrum]